MLSFRILKTLHKVRFDYHYYKQRLSNNSSIVTDPVKSAILHVEHHVNLFIGFVVVLGHTCLAILTDRSIGNDDSLAFL